MLLIDLIEVDKLKKKLKILYLFRNFDLVKDCVCSFVFYYNLFRNFYLVKSCILVMFFILLLYFSIF